MTRVAGEDGFQSRRCGAGAQAIMQNRNGNAECEGEKCHTDNDQQSSAFHGSLCMLKEERYSRQRGTIRGHGDGVAGLCRGARVTPGSPLIRYPMKWRLPR